MGTATTAGSASPAARARSQAAAEMTALTGVRFFAAIFVVLYHYERLTLAHAPRFVQNIGGTGYIAVGFFFMLSGFVLAYSNLSHSGALRCTTASFWAARMARIYPAYLTAFLIVAPFNIERTMHANHFATGAAKLAAGGSIVLALLQSWTPWSAWYWNFPAWSLSVEMFFYLTFPVIVPWTGRLNRRQCAGLLTFFWLAAIAVPSVFVALHSSTSEPPFSKLQQAIEVTPLMRLPEFICGVLLGRLYALDSRRGRRIGGTLAVAGIAAIAVVLSFSDVIPRPLLANGLMAPLFGLVIFGLAQGRGIIAAVLSAPFLVLLGEASYGIYILQYPMASIFGVENNVYTPVRTACFVFCLIAASILCFRYIESPLRGRLRRKLTGPLESLISKAPSPGNRRSVPALLEKNT